MNRCDALREFSDAILPEGAVFNEAVLVTSYISVDGGLCWGVVTATSDGPVSTVVGLLEMAKADMIAHARAAE